MWRCLPVLYRLAVDVGNRHSCDRCCWQADGMGASGATKPRYRGFIHALSDIVKTEGFWGLYKGVGPNCGRATVLCSAELATYDRWACDDCSL